MGKPMVHHDALEFPDGETVLLTRLCEGQHATVLQLPARNAAIPEDRRIEFRIGINVGDIIVARKGQADHDDCAGQHADRD
jgi:class 3 adenylate cyclase